MKLLDVRPLPTGNGLTDSSPGNSVQISKRLMRDSAGHVAFSDGTHLIASQFGVSASFSARHTASLDHLRHVTSVCVRHQMGWPNTANIATVAEVGHVWRLSGRLMAGRQDVSNYWGGAQPPSKEKDPATVAFICGGPKPAPAKFHPKDRPVPGDLIPETLTDWFPWVYSHRHRDHPSLSAPGVTAHRGFLLREFYHV